MRILDRLVALDDRIESRSSAHRGWVWSPLVMPVTFGSFAMLDLDRPDSRGVWLACAASAYSAGRQILRTRDALRAEGRDLPLRRLRASSRFLVPLAIYIITFAGYIGPEAKVDREVDVVRARALVQAVLDTAATEDRADICEVAYDESACRKKVASAPAPVGKPEIFKTLSLGEDGTSVAVYFFSASPPDGCVLAVTKYGDELIIYDPVYWAKDCGGSS